MKIKVTRTAVFDTADKQLWKDYLEYQDDNPLTFESLKEYLIYEQFNDYFKFQGEEKIKVTIVDGD